MLLGHVERAIDDLQVKRADIDRTLKELRKIRDHCTEHLSSEAPSGRRDKL
jgi:hypothetical protein